MMLLSRLSDVRRAQLLPSLSTEELLRFADSGWQKAAPTSFILGPSGPLSLAQFFIIRAIDGVVSLHEPMARHLDVPAPVALFSMLFFLVFISTTFSLAGSMWLAPTRRRPAVIAPPQPLLPLRNAVDRTHID